MESWPRACATLCCVLLPSALTACEDRAIAIRVGSSSVPALVVFRDGTDAPWQPMTAKTPILFEAEVHGPYMVTVVCERRTPGSFGGSDGFWETWQVGRASDDPHELSAPCDTYSSPHTVTGSMAQPGFLQLAGSTDSSIAGNWGFQLAAPDGSYDLIAITADRIAIRRALAVAEDLALTPPIDVAQEGAVLVDVPLSVTGAAPDETLIAAVLLETPTTLFAAAPYSGAAMVGKAIPDSALLATDRQTIEMQARHGNASRGVVRPFRIGGDTAFVLPPALGEVQWTIEDGQIAVGWVAPSEIDKLLSLALGATADHRAARYDLDVTSGFVSATGTTHIATDTNLPGYLPAWQINFTSSYTRGLFSHHATNGDDAFSSIIENVGAPAFAGRDPAFAATGTLRGLRMAGDGRMLWEIPGEIPDRGCLAVSPIGKGFDQPRGAARGLGANP